MERMSRENEIGLGADPWSSPTYWSVIGMYENEGLKGHLGGLELSREYPS